MNTAQKFFSITHALLYTVTRLVMFLVLRARGHMNPTIAGEHTKVWSRRCLQICNIEVEKCGEAIEEGPCLFVGNHTSYMDIVVLFTLRHFVFVAKREVLDWPLFGYAAKSAGTIFVDRASIKSRKEVTHAIEEGILNDKKGVIVFPEGSSSIEGRPWKRGSFGIAQRGRIKVQPFAITYTPVRESAFIDNDALITHLWKWLGVGPRRVRVEFLKTRFIDDATIDTAEIENSVNSIVRREVQKNGWVLNGS